MEDFSANSWRYKGSSLVFDRGVLSGLLETAQIYSLRQALSWQNNPPPPPASRSTILISGLETLMQLLPPPKAHDFLLYRIRPLVIRLQNSWECGLIFGFASPPQAFTEDPLSDEVIYQTSSRQQVRLSAGIWGAGDALKRLVHGVSAQGKEETLGYHVPRLS